jgi:serine/threonine protein phosphatase 1
MPMSLASRVVSIPVEISAWKPAPFAIGGETVFAIGDIHGCAPELGALLDTVVLLAREQTGQRRLVYLGDIVDRGPDTIGALRLWAEDAAARGVERIDRIIGNHEIVMLLTLAGSPHAAKAEAMWLSDGMGGARVLEEMRQAVGDPRAKPSYHLAAAALGEKVMRLMLTQRSHLCIGNTVFVHGGLDGGADQKAFLAPPWTSFTDARWAWITQGFLDWRGGFGGTLVVHGHTPPAKQWRLTHMEDPHLFLHDRLGLDGGSAVTGFVVGAEIQDGRYRILTAGSPLMTSRNAGP